MFEYQIVINRTNDLLAEAENARLVREAQRAKKARRASDRRRPRRP